VFSGVNGSLGEATLCKDTQEHVPTRARAGKGLPVARAKKLGTRNAPPVAKRTVKRKASLL